MPGASAPVPPAADPLASDQVASDPGDLESPSGDAKPPAAGLVPASAGLSLSGDSSSAESPSRLPGLEELVEVFGGFYFGGDPDGDPAQWRGFIGSEPLLVKPTLFSDLDAAGIAWGFVSGAEPPSVRFVLEQRLGLVDPPRIAMGEAPDKPDPTGFLRLAERLLAENGCPGLGASAPPVAYLGDTVADVLTVQRARQRAPQQRFLSLAVAPPHLQRPEASGQRGPYETQLRQAGADAVIASSDQVLAALLAAIT